MDPISLLIHHQARANQLQTEAANHRQARHLARRRRRLRTHQLAALVSGVQARLRRRASQQACCA